MAFENSNFGGLPAGKGASSDFLTRAKQLGKGAIKGTFETAVDILEFPQKAATLGIESLLYAGTLGRTKKPEYETPGEALGLEGLPKLVTDVFVDPVWVITSPIAGAKALKLDGALLEKLGPLYKNKYFYKDSGAIREAAKVQYIKELEKKGFKNISEQITDTWIRNMDKGKPVNASTLKEIETARRVGPDVLETLSDKLLKSKIEIKTPVVIRGEVDKMVDNAIETIWKKGVTPQWLTQADMELKSLSVSKWFDDAALKFKVPFTNLEKTLLKTTTVEKGLSSLSESLNKLKGFKEFSSSIRGIFTSVGKGTEKAAVATTDMRKFSISQGLASVKYRAASLADSLKQLKRENEAFGTKAFGEVLQSIERKLYDETLTIEEASKMSKPFAAQLEKFMDEKKLLQELYGEVAPELKGWKIGQYLTKEGKEWVQQFEKQAPKIAGKVESLTESKHRGWFRFIGETKRGKGFTVREEFVGKASDDGRNLAYFGQKELNQLKKSLKSLSGKKSKEVIKETNKIVSKLEKSLQGKNYNSYIPKNVVDKIKRGTITLEEVDKKLFKAYSEIPQVLNEAARKKYGIDFDLFSTNYFDNVLQDMERQVRAISHESMAGTMIKSDYIQAVGKKSKVYSGWKEVPWLKKSKHAKKGETYWANPDTADYLNRFYDTMFTNEGVNAVYNGIRGFTAWWKSWTLGIFPAYHFRNAIDDGFRMWFAAGMNPKESMYDPYKTFLPMLRRMKEGKLTAKEDEFINLAKNFEIIENNAIRDIEDFEQMIGSTGVRGALNQKLISPGRDNKLVQGGFSVGNILENSRRLSMFSSAMKKGMSAEEAATLVRRVLFDYGDLTQTERFLKNTLLPFYTFFRKSSELYIKEILANPGKYSALFKLQGDIDPSLTYPGEVPFAIPKSVSKFVTGSSKQYYFDMSNYLSAISTPQQLLKLDDTIFNMLNPLFKIPLELQTDYDFFKGRQNFEAETEELFGKGWEKNTLTYKALTTFRPVNEVDRLFFRDKSSLGEDIPKWARLLRTFTGINIKEFDTYKRTQSMQKKIERDKRFQKALERNLRRIEER